MGLNIVSASSHSFRTYCVYMANYINLLFKEKREQLHRCIRLRALGQVKEMLQERDDECVMLAIAKNERSWCSLHVAVLSQNDDIVRFLAENFPATLNVVDNVRKYLYIYF